MALSTINPDNVIITMATAGEDVFDDQAAGYAELLGIEGISISGGEKDIELKVGYAAASTGRFFVVEKPATVVELKLEHAVFNFDIYDTWFAKSTKLSDTTTKTLAVGIKLTAEDASLEKWEFDPCYITSVELEGSKDETIKATLTFKASPEHVLFTTA